MNGAYTWLTPEQIRRLGSRYHPKLQVHCTNATGRTNQIRRCFRVALALFVALGIVGTVAMLVFTEQLAAWMNNSMAYWPIKALGVSVICVSIMCAFRGYAQGRQNMVPTAMSQLIEQVGKVAVASREEQEENPRSRSAKLRIGEKK